MESSRSDLKQRLDNAVQHFSRDITLYNKNSLDREHLQYAKSFLSSVGKIVNELTEENSLASILKLHKFLVSQDRRLVDKYYYQEFKWAKEINNNLQLIVNGYYQQFTTNFVTLSSNCDNLLGHELFDDEKHIDLLATHVNKFRFAIKPLLELQQLNQLTQNSCTIILNLEEFNDARILRLIINSIVNGLEVNQENFFAVKNILQDITKEILDVSGFDKQDDEKVSDLIIDYVGKVIPISAKDEEILREVMDLLKLVIKNDPLVFFANMFEETVTLQLPFVIKQLRNNNILNTEMMKYLYSDLVLAKNSESGNQVMWLAEQSKKHDEKLTSVRDKLHQAINLKKKYDMSLLLLIASQCNESIFSYAPREITILILNLYGASLPQMEKEIKPTPFCLFFNKPEKIIENPKHNYETAFVKKS